VKRVAHLIGSAPGVESTLYLNGRVKGNYKGLTGEGGGMLSIFPDGVIDQVHDRQNLENHGLWRKNGISQRLNQQGKKVGDRLRRAK